MTARVLAKTVQGSVEGREKDGALLFAGIPYAAPPVGGRRFGPPEPHPGWTGVRAARRFGPGAPQLPGRGPTAAPVRWDEDCLTLNVCTPAVDEGRRPVLVWIHGGAFRTGKSGIPWYNGASFARRGDVVTVTINYRLGALGFLHPGDLAGSEGASAGVNGLLDQISALAWVRDNIAGFGGDPGRVTIAGESAGAMSVGTLLGCPRAEGLFHGAIAQSGAAHHVASREAAEAVGVLFRRCLEAELGADVPDLEALRAAPVEAILAAQRRVEETLAGPETRKLDGVDVSGLGDMAFRPVVEGDVLPRPPLDAVRGGLSATVPLLVGTNRDEATLFLEGEVDAARLDRAARRLFGEACGEALDAYRGARPEASARELLLAILTDQMFRIPAVRLAEAQIGAGGRCFQYLFSWASPAFGGRLGATHALEIPFTFHALDAPGVDVFLGDAAPPHALADAMHAAWTAFVQAGDPSAPDAPPWPAYDLARRPVMEFGERIGVLPDPGGDARRLWEGRH